jgi:hypothetical protein
MKARLILFTLLYILNFHIAFGQILPSFIDTSGLVAFYSFNGNANDLSGRGNNGTILGGATFQNDRLGQANQAILLDGVNDYISIPRNSSLEPTNALTINAWITPTRMANSGWRNLIVKPTTPGVDPYVSYSIQSSSAAPINNKWQFNLSDGTAGSLKSVLAKEAFPDKDTLMLTAVLSQGVMKLYINGKLDTARTFTGNIGYSAQNLLIGYGMTGANEYYKGAIDEIAIWNKPLTENQIEAIYNNGGCSPRFGITKSKPVYELNDNATINGPLLNNRTYQWQANPLHLGWINVTNGLSYSGSQTNELTINKLMVGHQNLPVRLIARNDFCKDTSLVTELQVNYCLPDTFYVADNATNDTLFISILSSISPNEQLVNRVLVYPNPASTELNFKLEKLGSYRAELTGVSGSVLVTTLGSKIDISGMAAGVYILSIYDASNRLISTSKIAIVK